ncbi:DUF305 domain-containing protein [Pelobium manganitolerans]|uniref:DUF305 domain-containing protein n=1 Tax=Pelobium manganitolerans TaxID=1842495 RepID=A0A419S519_9SPHI|nr:DUF305 domain-containing protein [Pelobium manganitolerans]RKD15167.1 DUF305 domain-containing protein [Pelobium manganitolerans]
MENKPNNYNKFGWMLLASFIIMYAVMFLNVDKLDHVYLSTTRAYMALLMVAPMALLMLAMMPMMYPNKRLNGIIALTSIAVFILTLVFLRNQTFISDRQYIKAMIPHHSSAILVSQEAKLKDPELKRLAEQIIRSQEKEITEMKQMLKRMENKD